MTEFRAFLLSIPLSLLAIAGILAVAHFFGALGVFVCLIALICLGVTAAGRNW